MVDTFEVKTKQNILRVGQAPETILDSSLQSSSSGIRAPDVSLASDIQSYAFGDSGVFDSVVDATFDKNRQDISNSSIDTVNSLLLMDIDDTLPIIDHIFSREVTPETPGTPADAQFSSEGLSSELKEEVRAAPHAFLLTPNSLLLDEFRPFWLYIEH